MLKALRRYAKTESIQDQDNENLSKPIYVESVTQKVPPIIWETSNISQIHSLLVLREAEIVLAKSHLTGNKYNDWFTRNRIQDLEIKLADLRKWLAEAVRKDKGDEY